MSNTSAHGFRPTFFDPYVERCFLSDDWGMFVFAWASCAVFVIVTCVISVQHLRSLAHAPICTQRLHYWTICTFPIVYVLSAALVLASPKAFVITELIQVNCEARTLSAFGIVFFTLVSNNACKTVGSEERVGARILHALAAQGPSKHFAVPPFGCWFKPCMSSHDLRTWHLRIVVTLIRQYTYLGPLLVGARLFSEFGMSRQVGSVVVMFTSIALKVSLMAVVYGLMIMYHATKELLHNSRMTAKFATLKVTLLLIAFQTTISNAVVHAATGGRGIACLGEIHLQQFCAFWLVTLESTLVAVAFRAAFPAEEIQDAEGTYLELLALDLEWQERHDLTAKREGRELDDAGVATRAPSESGLDVQDLEAGGEGSNRDGARVTESV